MASNQPDNQSKKFSPSGNPSMQPDSDRNEPKKGGHSSQKGVKEQQGNQGRGADEGGAEDESSGKPAAGRVER
jgi:hypothetical protein